MGALLKTASAQSLKNLLMLYPNPCLQDTWANEGSKRQDKKEIASRVAEKQDIKAIAKFGYEFLSCCRQHIYTFSHDGDISKLPEITLPNASKEHEEKEHGFFSMLYVIELKYEVTLRDPPEEETLTFLWPARLDFTKDHLLFRFVTLEKDIGSYVDGRPYSVFGKSTSEDKILQTVLEAVKGKLNLEAVDLNKGVKKLWEDGVIDSPRANFRKTNSRSSEAMNANLFIKQDSPEIYETLKGTPLLHTQFDIVNWQDLSVSKFSTEPLKGYIAFPRYSENLGDTDHVVREILRHN